MRSFPALRGYRASATLWLGLVSQIAGILLILLPMLSSCDIRDERDICCEEVTLVYRYVRTNKDEYASFISRQRHFLFNDEGVYLREIGGNPRDPQRLPIGRLTNGEYTVVTIGNFTDGETELTEPEHGVTRLEDFRLALLRKSADNKAFGNSEELFWNSRTFKAVVGKKRTILCDMANIHCHLELKVTWEDAPPIGNPEFVVELSNLTPQYQLEINPKYTIDIAGSRPSGEPESRLDFVWHQFPKSDFAPTAKVRSSERLRGHDLYPSVTTLRYRNDRIPVLQILHDEKPLFNTPIDLAPLFTKWGWFPDMHHEQIYRIELRILKNGFVEIRPWSVSSSVLDWEDGGTFS